MAVQIKNKNPKCKQIRHSLCERGTTYKGKYDKWNILIKLCTNSNLALDRKKKYWEILDSAVRLKPSSQCILTFSHLYKTLKMTKKKKKSVLCSAFRFQLSMKQEVICEGPPLSACVPFTSTETQYKLYRGAAAPNKWPRRLWLSYLPIPSQCTYRLWRCRSSARMKIPLTEKCWPHKVFSRHWEDCPFQCSQTISLEQFSTIFLFK